MKDYFCEICDKHINIKRKSNHFKLKSRIEIGECDHIMLSLKDVKIDVIDETCSLYKIEHIKKYDYCKAKGQFKLVFDGGQHTVYISARLFDNRTRICWKEFLNGIISGLLILVTYLIMLVK